MSRAATPPGGTLPLGYHDLEIETADDILRSRIIAAPRRAYTPPGQSEWGVFMPLYAVRGAEDWGVGSYTDLQQLARWTRARGGAFVGTLPLLASFVDVCFEPSPYAPVSRLFWNEQAVTLEQIPALMAAEAVLDPQPEIRLRADLDTRCTEEF